MEVAAAVHVAVLPRAAPSRYIATSCASAGALAELRNGASARVDTLGAAVDYAAALVIGRPIVRLGMRSVRHTLTSAARAAGRGRFPTLWSSISERCGVWHAPRLLHARLAQEVKRVTCWMRLGCDTQANACPTMFDRPQWSVGGGSSSNANLTRRQCTVPGGDYRGPDALQGGVNTPEDLPNVPRRVAAAAPNPLFAQPTRNGVVAVVFGPSPTPQLWRRRCSSTRSRRRRRESSSCIIPLLAWNPTLKRHWCRRC